MKLRYGASLLLVVLCRPCLAQDPPAAADLEDPPDTPPVISKISFPDRPVSWFKLVPNIAHDQKDIWTFPISVAQGRHIKPTLIVSAITVAAVAGGDEPSGRYFQRSRAYIGFNRVFSGNNTSLAMFVAPSVFYGISLIRRDSYGQNTFLLAGEAVLDSEIVTSVIKDIDRRLKPIEVPPGGDFSHTWFASGAGKSAFAGIGSFPSGHTIAAFSVATVFADRYPMPRWFPRLVYGVAGAVGFSRTSLQSHHPSDVFAGAALGYSIAHYAVLHARD